MHIHDIAEQFFVRLFAGRSGARWVLSAALLLLAGWAGADTGKFQLLMNIHINGTIVATGMCRFNQGHNVTVGFGTVRYVMVSGKNTLEVNYRQPVPGDMNCSGDTGGAWMKLSSTGGGETWQGLKILSVKDDNTGKENGLGIRLLVNGQAHDIDSPFPVDMQNPPRIEVELVQTGDGSQFISGDTFNASATLVMAFN